MCGQLLVNGGVVVVIMVGMCMFVSYRSKDLGKQKEKGIEECTAANGGCTLASYTGGRRRFQ